eukprot:COSAG01_NODE_3303_length_6294_cov_3.018402_5_plen_701_part_00
MHRASELDRCCYGQDKASSFAEQTENGTWVVCNHICGTVTADVAEKFNAGKNELLDAIVAKQKAATGGPTVGNGGDGRRHGGLGAHMKFPATKAGIENLKLRMMRPPENSSTPIFAQFPITSDGYAAFLMAYEDGRAWLWWYGGQQQTKWVPEFGHKLGVPVEKASLSQTGVYSRHFSTGAKVEFDTVTGNGSFSWPTAELNSSSASRHKTDDTAPCSLNGNWTSHRRPGDDPLVGQPTPSGIVHIEFFQRPGHSNFTVRATPWGAFASHGHVVGTDHIQLRYVGDARVRSYEISAAPDGPPCTMLSNGWCKFPWCGFPEPSDWPPWPPVAPPAPPPPPSPPAPVPTPSPSSSLPKPPNWAPNWNFTESTVIQPTSSGYFSPNNSWGLVSLDWSVAKDVWLAHGRNHSNCEAVSTEGCRRLKAAGKATRCFIYHNMELALEWLESQRKVMYDPDKADYFLQYTDGNGKKNGTIYQEDRAEGDQYFWDFTHKAAADYFVESVVASVSHPAVDGTFTDDVTGAPAEHPHATQRVNMTASQAAALAAATWATHQRLVTALIAAGKFNWQAFSGSRHSGEADSSGPVITQAACADTMARLCTPERQAAPMLMGAGDPPSNQSVAAFLISRPPVGYFGYGWEGKNPSWHPIFLLQPGEPMGPCTERVAGVFERQWSNGKAVLDCNEWNAKLPFPSLGANAKLDSH